MLGARLGLSAEGHAETVSPEVVTSRWRIPGGVENAFLICRVTLADLHFG